VTAVMPRGSRASRLAVRLSFSSSWVGGGMYWARRSWRSRMMPLSRPSSPRSITPPSGWGVAGVISPKSRAVLFATALWPPARVRSTGLSGAASSRSSPVGLAPLRQRIFGPAVARDPLPRSEGLGFLPHRGLQILDGGDLLKGDIAARVAMNMAVYIVKARKHGLSLKVPGHRAGEAVRKLEPTDRDNAAVVHREGAALWSPGSAGEDGAVEQQQIDRCFLGLGRAGAQAEKQAGKRADHQNGARIAPPGRKRMVGHGWPPHARQ
jgi:hypothetical protein